MVDVTGIEPVTPFAKQVLATSVRAGVSQKCTLQRAPERIRRFRTV
jgi:hypothetical protein